MAAAALVACAGGGTITFAKRNTLDRVLDSVEQLKAFDVHQAVDLFNDFASGLRHQPEATTARALSAVAAVAGVPTQADLVLRIACAMGRAEGGYQSVEIASIHDLAAALGLPAPELSPAEPVAAAGHRPKIIVLGNQKGGTGKSTTAMHLTVALLKLGHKVGSIDLDAGQETFTHYIANRAALRETTDSEIEVPVHRLVARSTAANRESAEREERTRLQEALAALGDRHYVVIDTPGNVSHLARLGHGQADHLITPLNDSLLDVDVLAKIDPDKRQVLEPSVYCRMVWEESGRRQAGGGAGIDWIVMRNRLAHIDARNTREISGLLTQLARRIGFRLEPGFSERVIYRELFHKGLTLIDLPEGDPNSRANASHHHGRQELRELVRALGVANAEAV